MKGLGRHWLWYPPRVPLPTESPARGCPSPSWVGTFAVLIALAGALSACSGDTSATGAAAAHTSACRTFALLAGGSAADATRAVSHAAESGSYDNARLRMLLAPVQDASLRAGLVAGLTDRDFAVFRDVHTAAQTAQARLGGSGILDNGVVADLQKTVAAEATACG